MGVGIVVFLRLLLLLLLPLGERGDECTNERGRSMLLLLLREEADDDDDDDVEEDVDELDEADELSWGGLNRLVNRRGLVWNCC